MVLGGGGVLKGGTQWQVLSSTGGYLGEALGIHGTLISSCLEGLLQKPDPAPPSCLGTLSLAPTYVVTIAIYCTMS